MSRAIRRPVLCVLAIATAVGATQLPAAAASQSPAYCPLPPGAANPAWGFHVGAAIQRSSGTYAHGNGTLSGERATGKICQVDRTVGSPDRQIILSVTRGAVVPQHAVIANGVLSNRMVLPVRVASSTDARCRVGTLGSVTLAAGFNGAHKDSVQLAFPRSCRDHNHLYTGPQVVALVPR